jgi:hypothetical protein
MPETRKITVLNPEPARQKSNTIWDMAERFTGN